MLLRVECGIINVYKLGLWGSPLNMLGLKRFETEGRQSMAFTKLKSTKTGFRLATIPKNTPQGNAMNSTDTRKEFSHSKNNLTSTRPIPSKGPSLAVLKQLAEQGGSGFWEMLGGVFDNLEQGIIIADRSGRVVVFNRLAEQIMGYQANEVVGHRSLWDFCDECDRPPLFRASLSSGNSFPEEEVEMAHKNNESTIVGVKVTALYGQDNRLEGALAVIRSLSEIRERESERKNLVRLAAIGRIISAVAHEINNPLQTVRTSLELALDPRKSAERRRQYLQAADQEINRISQVIGQMRSFYRPTPIEKQPSQLNDRVRSALNLLEKPLREAEVTVLMQLDEALPTVNLIDYQLEQVFLNLILNAIETLPDGGQLTISSQLIEPSRVAISFNTNTSNQHTPQRLEHIFDPLESRRNAGLAIGLSVSREIIHEMGGTVEVSDVSGLTLTVYLPC